MGIQKLQEIHGSADLGIIGKVKRGKNRRLKEGSNPDPPTNDSKEEANQESCIGNGDDMKGKKLELSKVSNYEIDEHRKEDDTMGKSSRRNRCEKLALAATFFDEGMSCSENRAIDEGVEESSNYKKEKKEKRKRKQKGITDFNSLKNASAEGRTHLEDEIIHGGSMVNEKDQKRQGKRKGNYMESANSTTCTDNCNWDEDKEHGKKRKRKDYFLEHEQYRGCSKKIAKEASEKPYMVISGGDTEEVRSRTNINNDGRKREKKKEGVANCKEFTLEMTTGKEKGDQRSTAATTNFVEKRKSDMNTRIGKDGGTNESYYGELKKDAKKGEKKVSFSKKVEEFPLNPYGHENLGPDNLVWGKRFTPEEDELIRKAIMDYIEENQLGERGVHMVLNSKSYKKEVKNCWKVITAALPWRPHKNTLHRAHILFERSEERKWEPEELELLKRYYAEHGPKWRKLGDILGKSRVHVKDAWRRIMLPNLRKGRWSQDEYQILFDLVNLDLRMKAFEAKKKKANHSVLKDNISWGAISNKMSTRGSHVCCLKWYQQLTSAMVQEGNWNDLDDYKLIEALQKADVCCFEDVDWDNLLGHRSGEICQKRWYEMIRHLDNFWAMTFIEQVDILSERYCPHMIKYREMKQNMNHVS